MKDNLTIREKIGFTCFLMFIIPEIFYRFIILGFYNLLINHDVAIENVILGPNPTLLRLVSLVVEFLGILGLLVLSFRKKRIFTSIALTVLLIFSFFLVVACFGIIYIMYLTYGR